MKKAVILILFALCPLTGLVLIQNSLLQRQASYKDIRWQLEAALEGTRSRQKNINAELRMDPALQQNLSMGIFSAAGRILSGYTLAGKIDRLLLVDEQCNIVAQSEQGVPLRNECPVSNPAAMKQAEFQWQNSTEGLSLNFVSPIQLPTGAKFYLKTSTFLGETWLHNQTHLGPLSQKMGLSFQENSKWLSKVLWSPDTPAGTKLQIYANDPWLFLFPNILSNKTLDLSLPLAANLILLFSSIGWLIIELQKREKSLSSTVKQLEDWTHELEGQSGPDRNTSSFDIETLKSNMSRIVKKNLEVQIRLEHQNKLLQQQIVSLEGRIVERQAEQAWFYQIQSLHQQMLNCAKSYMEKLQESLSLSEDLSYIASREIFKPAQRLFELSTRWDLDLSKQNPKKFLRTLTERTNEQGRSELEDSLDQLIQDSHNVGNCAINLSMLSQRLIKELKSTLSLAEHWQAMMQDGKRDQQSLLGLLQESQALIKLQEEALRLSYDNLVESDQYFEGLEIPASTLTSALYHAHLALIETARDKGALQLHLSTQLKKRPDRHILVLSLRSEGQDQLIPGADLPAKASQHLSLAIQLLQGHAAKITALPPLPGVYALAFIWHPETKTTIPSLAADFGFG